MVGMVLPIHVLLTKSDKLTRSAVNIQIMRTRQQMKHKQHTVSSLSTLNRRGLEQLEQRCKQWLDIK
jgi:GTP-binding protein